MEEKDSLASLVGKFNKHRSAQSRLESRILDLESELENKRKREKLLAGRVERLKEDLYDEREKLNKLIRDEFLTKEDQRLIRVWLRKIKNVKLAKEEDGNKQDNQE